MLRRLFWLVAGIAVGAWGTVRVNRAARRLTPEGLARTAAGRAAELGGRLRRFTDDVRAGMAEREAELGHILGREERGPGSGHPAPYEPGFPGRHPGNAYDRKDDH